MTAGDSKDYCVIGGSYVCFFVDAKKCTCRDADCSYCDLIEVISASHVIQLHKLDKYGLNEDSFKVWKIYLLRKSRWVSLKLVRFDPTELTE